jgi:GlpG protein
MRQIGTVSDQAAAERFTAFLITQGLAAQAEQEGELWAIWIRNEDQVATAKEAFRQFAEQPDDPRYAQVIHEAQRLLQQEADRREQARRNLVEVGLRWRRPSFRRTPLTNVVLGLCIVVFVLSGLGAERDSAARRMLLFRDPPRRVAEQNDRLQEDRLADIRNGQVWRLVTPIFLHVDLLHLVFNLLMFHFFASRIEDRLGTVRLAGMILVIALLSNTAQALAPGDWGAFSGGTFFCGISGVVYGLFGYVWVKSIYQPGLGLLVSGSTVALLVIWMFLGLFGVLDRGLATHASDSANQGGIANLTHVVGLLAGLGLSYWPVIWKRLTAGG